MLYRSVILLWFVIDDLKCYELYNLPWGDCLGDDTADATDERGGDGGIEG